MQRVETYILTKNKSKKDFYILVDLCHKSKNLYNAANYIVRQVISNKLENISDYADLVRSQSKTYKSKKDGSERTYIQNFISEFDLSKRMSHLNQVDYKSLKAQSSQQIIALLFKNYKAFYNAMADYSKNPSKYHGRPKMPKYKDKNGLNVLIFTNQNSSISKDGYLRLSKDFKLKSVKTTIQNKNFRQVRIVPKLDYFKIEIVYEKIEGEYVQYAKLINKRTNNAAIDIGVDNLATVTSDNKDSIPLIVNGRSLKSVNQFYNKALAKLNETYSRHDVHTGKKLKTLNRKREFVINDFMHKASRRIVDYCILNDIGRLYVGHNSGWKQNCNMSKQNNQNFIQIPFNKLIQMLRYKCEEVGIEVELINEAYTSKCSSLDNEVVGKHDEYCGKRQKRGLFRSSRGKLLNADVNGSLNILRCGLKNDFDISNKVFNPRCLKNMNELCDIAYFDWQSANRGYVFQPYNSLP